MRPTVRALFVLCAGIPVCVGIGLADAQLWPLGGIFIGGALTVIGLDILLAPWRRDLEVTTEVPGALFIGRDATVRATVNFAGRAAARAVELLCVTSPPLVRPLPIAVEPNIDANTEDGDNYAEIPLTAERRGEGTVSSVWVRWQGPLGLVERSHRVAVEETVAVVPDIQTVRTHAIRFVTRSAPFGAWTQRQHGGGTQFDALREYMPGLDHRSIDWKHSARHRKLLCKEFQVERNQQIVLAFDTGRLMSEPLDGIPRLDRAINAALLMGYTSLRAGDRVGLLGFDAQVRRFVEPIGGLHNFPRIQQEISGLDYRFEETNFTLGLMGLSDRLKRRTLIVVMTEFVDTVTAELMVENLARLSTRHLVLFVAVRDSALRRTVEREPREFGDLSRAVIADGFVRDREVVLRRLTRLGVRCVEAPHQRINAHLLNEYLAIKRRDLL
jgi:uncharacterized protein (DUF58 family)